MDCQARNQITNIIGQGGNNKCMLAISLIFGWKIHSETKINSTKYLGELKYIIL